MNDPLWRAVLAAPDDDGPRHTLAAELRARGEPLGELIDIQCRPDYATDRALISRAMELLEKHRHRWNDELGLAVEGVRIDDYVRGLPYLALVALGEDALAILDRAPIKWIRLDDRDQAVRPLAAMKAIAKDPRLARIDAINTTGGVACLAELLASPYFLASKLIIEAGECTDDGAALVARAHLPKLRTLILAGNNSPISDGGFEDLVHGDLPALRALEARGLGITGASLRALAVSQLAQLESLAMHSERGLGGAFTEFGELAAFARLSELDLSRCKLGGADLAGLASSSAFPALRHLDLSLNPITDEGLAAFAHSDGLPQLESLDLGHGQFGVPGVAALACSVRLAKLRRLSLSGATRGPEAAITIAASPNAASLHELDLSECKGRDEAAYAVAQSPHLGSLEKLVFYGNRVTDAGRAALYDRFGARALIDR